MLVWQSWTKPDVGYPVLILRRSSDGARCLKVGVHEKTNFINDIELTKGFPTAPYVQVWGRISGPSLPHEYEFGICGDAISCCLGGLTLVPSSSIFCHVLNASPTPAHPISMPLWRNYETYIFKKWCTYPKTPVAPTVVRFKDETTGAPWAIYTPGLNLALNGPERNSWNNSIKASSSMTATG